MSNTCRCGAEWTGMLTAHCGSCHETFSAVGPFDRHRKGGACNPPTDFGMADMGRAYRCWGFPMDEQDSARMKADYWGDDTNPPIRETER